MEGTWVDTNEANTATPFLRTSLRMKQYPLSTYLSMSHLQTIQAYSWLHLEHLPHKLIPHLSTTHPHHCHRLQAHNET